MIEQKTQSSTRLPRALFACLISLGMLVASVSAYSDTYNFYFTKPKKKGGAVDNQPAADGDDAEDQAPPAPAPAAHQNQVAVSPNGQQPIIINNNNNISMPSTPASTPEPVAPAPSTTTNEAATVATGVLVDEYRSPWHFGLSTAFYTGRRQYQWYSGSYDWNDGYYSSGYSSYESTGSQWAGLLNLGVDFTRSFGLNLYASQVVAGHTSGDTFDAGGDLELSPFHISGPKYDYVRIGMLAGTSAAVWNDSVPFHVGGRITFNFDRQFGFTGAVRTNFHMAMAEAGIVTHF